MAVDASTAEKLNRECFCVTLDTEALRAAIARQVGDDALARVMLDARPHLFSRVSVFLSDESLAQMHRVVRVIERVARLPDYWRIVSRWAPRTASRDFGPAGAFMGYDFHVAPSGPRLIEINTNAGGALLNAVLAEAQAECCGTPAAARNGFPAGELAARVGRMFEEEWRRQRGTGAPTTVAIVDDEPEAQYLYPEFLLVRALLQRAGIRAIIADPAAFAWAGGQLLYDDAPVDLVYNRLVDFDLSDPRHAALRGAYLSGAAVLTPNPHVHARFADKRNLTVLSDEAALSSFNLAAGDIDLLTESVPKTILLTAENAAELWAARREFFFKPASGYGSKAAYRGAKLTRRVWAQMLEGSYVAQAYAPPNERMIAIDGAVEARKMDVRLYTYEGEILLPAARLYKGQTTNFRTEGGGFAPVLRPLPAEICPAGDILSSPPGPE